ncbi:hypothetical protein ES703_87780 [subsurface metagenome]
MDWDKAELEGLSAAQLGLLLEVAFGWLPEYRRGLLVKLATQMRQVNTNDKPQ